MRKTALLLLLSAPRLVFAQASTQASGYVVKVDSNNVYLDFGDKSGAQVGERFTIYKEGEELVHPVTGKPLGRVETNLAEGALREIHSGYSIGTLDKMLGAFGSGARAKLASAPRAEAAAPLQESPGMAAPVPAKGPGDTAAARAPRWRSPIFDFPIQGMAIGDFKGDGKLELALADGKKGVYLYPYPPQDAKPVAQYELPSVAARILSLEAADINGDGRAELFVTAFNESFNRAETTVVALGSDGKLEKQAEIAAIVHAHQDGQGRPVLAMQQLEDDQTFPFGAIQPVVYSDGKYGHGGALHLGKRVDWIYGFTTAKIDAQDEPRSLFITPTESLRIEFKEGHSKTDDSIGQTPVRFTWAGRILQCHPHMPVLYDDKGFSAIYLIENSGTLWGMGSTFGKFSSAQIMRMGFNGLGLFPVWKSPVTGYATALELVTPPGAAQELAAAVVGTSGKSSVWVYDP